MSSCIDYCTHFQFSVGDIISGSKLEYSSVLTPLRLILILIVTSFLVAILDLSARMIVHPLSMVNSGSSECKIDYNVFRFNVSVTVLSNSYFGVQFW